MKYFGILSTLLLPLNVFSQLNASDRAHGYNHSEKVPVPESEKDSADYTIERVPLSRYQTADHTSTSDKAFSRDLYLKLSSRHLRALGYRLRGFANRRVETYVNGILMNNPGQGGVDYGTWGGLQYKLTVPMTNMGQQPGGGVPGGLHGLSVWNFDPGKQRQQTRLQYSFSNDIPGNNLSLVHHSGLLQNDWAWSIAANRRWIKSAYIPGTYFDGSSLYFGLRRKIGKKLLLNWNSFAAPVNRGLRQATTQEALNLNGDPYYNPTWGYQGNQLRNAVNARYFIPGTQLNLDWETGTNSLLRFAVSAQWGRQQLSSLDWYDAPDPRADYYKKLPSYYFLNNEPDLARELEQRWKLDPEYRQIDWEALYQTNRINTTTINGITGNRSLYVLGADSEVFQSYNLAIQFHTRLLPSLYWNSGMQITCRPTQYFREMLDLLGGDFFVNLNRFAERNFPHNHAFHQNNLLEPNAIIRAGDIYSYHYRMRYYRSFLWTHFKYAKKRFKVFLSGRATYTGYQRFGFYKNGLFPQDSYGLSSLVQFLCYQLKAGMEYQLKQQHFFSFLAGIKTEAPDMENVYISPETRNTKLSQAVPEQWKSVEFAYRIESPVIRTQLSGLIAEAKNISRILRFYHEAYHNSVLYAMQGLGKRHIALELAAQIRLLRKLYVEAAGSWKQVFYTSRPHIEIYRDNDTNRIVYNSPVYIKHYYADVGPQTAATIGIRYQPFHRSMISVHANFTNRHYLEMNPSRLTDKAIQQLEPGSTRWNAILSQKKLPETFTLDAFAGKTFQIKMKGRLESLNLELQVGVNNLLDNKKIISSGYQQLRFDFVDKNPEKFPEKYRYLPGRIFYIGLELGI